MKRTIDTVEEETSPQKRQKTGELLNPRKRGIDTIQVEFPSQKREKTCQLVIPLFVIHTSLSGYARRVSSIFFEQGIELDIRIVNKNGFQNTIDDRIKQGCTYTLFINIRNEECETVSFGAFNTIGDFLGNNKNKTRIL